MYLFTSWDRAGVCDNEPRSPSPLVLRFSLSATPRLFLPSLVLSLFSRIVKINLINLCQTRLFAILGDIVGSFQISGREAWHYLFLSGREIQSCLLAAFLCCQLDKIWWKMAVCLFFSDLCFASPAYLTFSFNIFRLSESLTWGNIHVPLLFCTTFQR